MTAIALLAGVLGSPSGAATPGCLVSDTTTGLCVPDPAAVGAGDDCGEWVSANSNGIFFYSWAEVDAIVTLPGTYLVTWNVWSEQWDHGNVDPARYLGSYGTTTWVVSTGGLLHDRFEPLTTNFYLYQSQTNAGTEYVNYFDVMVEGPFVLGSNVGGTQHIGNCDLVYINGLGLRQT